MIKTINMILVLAVLYTAFLLITERYAFRTRSNYLSDLQKKAQTMNQEYTRLQIELGTYSSGLVLQDFAYNKFGLINPDSKHIMEIEKYVSK